jgi:SAM-dependent methyltransferase
LTIAVQPAAKEPRRRLVPAACVPKAIEAIGPIFDRSDGGDQGRGRVRGRPAGAFRIDAPRKLEQIVVLGARQRERLRDAAESLGGGLHRAPLLDPRTPGHADAGQRGEFLAPEAGGSPPARRRPWQHTLPVSAHELAKESPLIRFKHSSRCNRIRFNLVTVQVETQKPLSGEERLMSKAHERVVEAQFGPRAKAYVESAVHSQGADLEAIGALAQKARPELALDLGAGGGHVAYALARHAQRVIATDLSSEMLAAVRRTALEKGLLNIETVEAPAERLPFEDEMFDFVASRFSTHHWRDFDAGLREARRTLKRGGRAAFVDVYAPGQALFDTHLQAIELLRDHSHVRDYTSAQWVDTLGRSGFAIEACRTWRLRMDFPVWIARMQTPDENVKAIRALQIAASAETRAHFAIEPDGSFLLDMLMVEASAA